MQRPNPGDPFLPAAVTNGHPTTGGYGAPAHTGGFPGQFPASPFAVANPTAPGTGHRSLPTIAELFHSFKRRWVLVLMVGGLLGTMFAAGVWMALPSGKHQARALIQVKTEAPNQHAGRQTSGEYEFDRFKEAELATMRTTGFLSTVAANDSVARQPLVQQSDDKAQTILGLLSTKFETAEMLAVTMNGDDAKQLKVILTVFVETYLAKAKDAQSDERNRNLLEINEAIRKLDVKINERKAALQKIADEQGAGVNGDSQIEKFVIGNQLSVAVADLKKAKDKVRDLQLYSGQLKAEQESGDYVVDPDAMNRELAAHPLIISKQGEVDAAAAELANFRNTLVASAPRLTEAEAKHQKALAGLTAERERLKASLLGSLKATRKQQLDLDTRTTAFKLKLASQELTDAEKDKANLEDRIAKLTKGGLGIFNEKNDLEPLRESRNALAKQQTDLEILNANSKPRVELKEQAQVYMNYNLKQKMVMAAGAGVIGLLGVMLLISYLEWRNRRVDGVDQVVSELGMRVIGTIPAFPSRASLRNGDAGQNQNWRFILNESVNSTRTMLLHTAKTQQMQVIMVTSAMQGEGKTSLSSQLATSMATAGLRTLILDCDLRNPSMQKLFDIPVAPGCSEILLQEIEIADAVQPTTVPNLWIIPAGQCNHRVIAALAQGHPLEAMFDRLRGQFDIIVVDSCPILPVADTLLVAQHVDGVVFSILQDVSQLPKVQDASDRMVQLNIPLLGAVVNGIKPDIQAYGYNYVKQLPA